MNTTDSIPPLDPLRSAAPGQFVTASYGRLHYILAQPETTPNQMVLCLHGFTTDTSIFKAILLVLASRGYLAVAVDLYGRGYSDAANKEIAYTDKFMVSTLAEFLLLIKTPTKGLSVEKMDVMGYSLGGGLAVAFADRFPELVASLFLLAPSGLPFEKPITARLVALPGLGEILFAVAGKTSLIKHVDDGWSDPMESETRQCLEQERKRLETMFDSHPDRGRTS